MSILDIRFLNSFFEPFIMDDRYVVWVRDKTFKKQIYISPNFEKIWEVGCEEIYYDPTGIWKNSLIDDYRMNWLRKAYQRLSPTEQSELTTIHYAIHGKKSGKPTFLRDTCYYLFDHEKNEMVGVAGIAEILSERAWESQFSLKNTKLNPQVLEFQQKLGHLNVHTAPQSAEKKGIYVDGQNVSFTRRQLEILQHVLLGRTAKEIGEIQDRSPRTVEKHIEDLKEKCNCKSKSDFLIKIKPEQVYQILNKGVKK